VAPSILFANRGSEISGSRRCDVPEELQDQARHAERHFASIPRAMQNVRYTRLKSAEPKARCLAVALTLPEHGPAYAEQKLGSITGSEPDLRVKR
jgi:hypothetical protein